MCPDLVLISGFNIAQDSVSDKEVIIFKHKNGKKHSNS